jgi:signal transduction histidine kinase
VADVLPTPKTTASASPAPAPGDPAEALARVHVARPPRDAGSLPEQVRTLFAYNTSSLAGNLIGAIVLVALLHGKATPHTLMGWAALMTVVWLLRAALGLYFHRAERLGLGINYPRALRCWNAGTLASGATWGLAVWLFYGQGDDALIQVSLLLIVYSYCVGSVPLLATQQAMFLGFNALCFVPTVARIATLGDAAGSGFALAGVMALIFAMTAVLGRNYRQAFDRLIELQTRSQQLLGQLRVEKTAAEQARRDAEVANRAKTQFFAAASHDLRQPLHALGLFAEALRARSQDEEVVQLVNSINGSVDALEDLFSELLDITKIDTGGVEVAPAHFKLDDVFRKLKLHFEPTAFEKGLELRFHGGQHAAHADPVLVERVLRNLLSNAIRYTVDGSVLVSARRRGESLLLQVWDTGVGIRERECERIFEEFYQVADSSVVHDPSQRKGLGLGLAIVKRLAALMKAPLTLHSRPGHGSVFSMEVPLGRAPRIDLQTGRSRPAIGLTLDRRLMVIVEDDAAVRSGLEVLLKSWGASVLSFDSVNACLGWAQAADAAQIRPDLLIADYRLESGHTGIEAITGLRRRFGDALPAIVVTGSLMSSHEKDAQEMNFHILLKPVVPNKLRAMIAFKLAMR